MKKLLLLAFCISVLALYGCAVVDSHPYYDLDQTSNNYANEPPWPPTPWELVKTDGKAHMHEAIGIMSCFPDHCEEVIWFFDQNPANGTIKLFNYINMEPASPAYTWHDDFYCNPDWNGCSWVTATRPLDYYDQYYPFTANWNCSDLTGGYLFAAWSYPGCGRDLPLEDKISLLNMGEMGELNGNTGLWFNLNKTNFSVTLENQFGQAWNVPILTDIPFWIDPTARKSYMDRTNPLFANMMMWYADWLDTGATAGTTVTLTFNGISDTFTIAGTSGFSSDAYRTAAQSMY
jgi:hypothetical protein